MSIVLTFSIVIILYLCFLYLYFSERNTQRGTTAPRGWENDQALMTRGRMKGGNKSDDDGEYPDMEGWEEADDEDDDISSADSEDENENENGRENGREDAQRRGKKFAHRSSNQNDIAFEKTLEEYGEEELGYLSEVGSLIEMLWHILIWLFVLFKIDYHGKIICGKIHSFLFLFYSFCFIPLYFILYYIILFAYALFYFHLTNRCFFSFIYNPG